VKLSKKMFYYINIENMDLNIKEQSLMLLKCFVKKKINIKFVENFSFDLILTLFSSDDEDLVNFFSTFTYYNKDNEKNIREHFEMIQSVLENAKLNCY
jgi:hypothetical protein